MQTLCAEKSRLWPLRHCQNKFATRMKQQKKPMQVRSVLKEDIESLWIAVWKMHY